jgi:hypothetical protein
MNDWRDQEVADSLRRTRAVGLPQYADEHRPELWSSSQSIRSSAKARHSG